MTHPTFITTPKVQPFPREGSDWLTYLSKVARISRGVDPFDKTKHSDFIKNEKTVRLCFEKKHWAILEFWPLQWYGCAGASVLSQDHPAPYPIEPLSHYETLAHIAHIETASGEKSWDCIQHFAEAPVDQCAFPPDRDYPCFYITCSRVALAQLTRYRYWFSYNVESQRYVRYGKHRPYEYYVDSEDQKEEAHAHSLSCYRSYEVALLHGLKPETARRRLSQDTTTRLAMAAPRKRWDHFLDQRLRGTTGKPQGEIRLIAEQIDAILNGQHS